MIISDDNDNKLSTLGNYFIEDVWCLIKFSFSGTHSWICCRVFSSSVNHNGVIELAQELAKDPKALAELWMDRTSASYKLTHGVKKTIQDDVLEEIRSVPFSFNIDEATSKTNKRALGVLVSYWSEKHERMVVKHLAALELISVTAESVHWMGFLKGWLSHGIIWCPFSWTHVLWWGTLKMAWRRRSEAAMPLNCWTLMVTHVTTFIMPARDYVVLLSIGLRLCCQTCTQTTNGQLTWKTASEKFAAYLECISHGQSAISHTGGSQSWKSVWTHCACGMHWSCFTMPSWAMKIRVHMLWFRGRRPPTQDRF